LIEAIVVAAGAGRRLGVKVPKALVKLKGRSLLTYSLKVFEAHPALDGVVVVAPKDFLPQFVKAARPFTKIRAVVAGGRLRADSVRCGLKALDLKTHTVLVHDAARPFVDAAMIDRLLAALRKNKAAIAGVPVKFTVKKVDGRTLDIRETPARELLWEAQTPQGFHRNVLVRAHALKSKNEATDDAVLVERMGGKVKMVMGSYRNIKITSPEDLIWARQLIGTIGSA
jgi:2-C-methyl-D-erythritol 4-phosphate cytidylyltransferase